MIDQSRPKIIKDHPIGDGHDAFHASFKLICQDRCISCSPDALAQFDQEGTVNHLHYDPLR